MAITEHEAQEIEKANATKLTPVVWTSVADSGATRKIRQLSANRIVPPGSAMTASPPATVLTTIEVLS